jgi:hypothetical protein
MDPGIERGLEGYHIIGEVPLARAVMLRAISCLAAGPI